MTTTPEITAALRERYAYPEFAFFQEVGDAGSQSRVFADGVAINMWRSRGYAISGFEVKSSRSDWLRELKQPGKAEPIFKKCDYFYLVAPDDVFVPDEVPISWGILAFKDGKLREKRKAPQLAPDPVTRAFVAQMFRRGATQEQRDISSLIDKALLKERESMTKRIDEAVKHKTRHLQETAEKWKTVEMAVGCDWLGSDDVIRAVQVVMKSGVHGVYSGLPELQRRLQSAHDLIGEALKPLGISKEAAE